MEREPEFIAKAEFFRTPTVAEIRDLQQHIDARSTEQVAASIARIIRNLAHDEYYLIEVPLLHGPNARYAQTVVRQADYLNFRRAQRTQGKDIFLAKPQELLAELFPFRVDTGGHPPFGYQWHVPGTNNQFVVKSILEEVEGALIFWYDMQAPNNATLEDRLKRDVRVLTGDDREHRAATNGVQVEVTVPSRTEKERSYTGIVAPVPVALEHKSIGYLWRKIHFTTSSRHGQNLNTDQPSEERLERQGERQRIDAQQNAQLHKIGLYFRHIEENDVPFDYLPVLRFHPKFLDYHSKLICNTLIADTTRADRRGQPAVRHLNDKEKNLLLMWTIQNNLLKNGGYYASIQPRADMTTYRLGIQGRNSP